ncbi:phage tail tip fiber protein [Pseudomonas sp. LF245]
MSGSIQSSNYVPGVSGWKLNALTGDFEIHSCTLGSAANAPERQMVSVEVASWSKYDLPKNAANLLQFMQAELQRVPEEYRHAAEFEEFDASYGDESFNARLFLSYSRLETEEELADRLEKAKVAGSHISIKNGVTTVSCDGVVRYTIGNLDQPESTPYQPLPFRVDGDQVYISEAALADAMISWKPIVNWSVKKQVNASGQYVVGGLGLGHPSQFLVSADRFAINDRSASEILQDIAGMIGETKLGRDLKEQADPLGSNLADQVKAVIRNELMPGGLLHRSR